MVTVLEIIFIAMHIFITGASGLIGKAVVNELTSAGHSVVGLARSDEAADKLKALKVDVLRGSLSDTDILREAARTADGVIHLAFEHDFANFDKSCETDRAAIQAMAEGMVGSNRPLIMTSGTLALPLGHLATEDEGPEPFPGLSARGESELLARSLASKDVRTIIMRVAAVNHGEGDTKFIPALINTAREKGVSAYLGDGNNHWPAVHILDTAVAFRLALEKAPAGSVLHIAAEEGVKIKDIASVIGEKVGVPVVSKTTAEAQEHFGMLAAIIAADNLVSSKKSREILGWAPQQYGLLEDLRRGRYFDA